jgi:hypothetical protein
MVQSLFQIGTIIKFYGWNYLGVMSGGEQPNMRKRLHTRCAWFAYHSSLRLLLQVVRYHGET